LLKFFWTRYKISSAVFNSKLEFLKSNRGMPYMFVKVMKFFSTFIQITSIDSDIILIKNRGKANLFCVLVCATVSECNKDISQTRAGFDMVPVANERYISLVSSTKISEFLDVPLQR
jgi:hypothetical protein